MAEAKSATRFAWSLEDSAACAPLERQPLAVSKGHTPAHDSQHRKTQRNRGLAPDFRAADTRENHTRPHKNRLCGRSDESVGRDRRCAVRPPRARVIVWFAVRQPNARPLAVHERRQRRIATETAGGEDRSRRESWFSPFPGRATPETDIGSAVGAFLRMFRRADSLIRYGGSRRPRTSRAV